MKTLLTLSCAVIVNSGLAAAQTSLTQNGQVTSGVVGITLGQTARFNILYPTAPAPILQILCSATLVFADDQGNVLKTNAVSQLTAGKSVSLDLNGDTDTGGRSRTQIHAFSISPSGCVYVATLELIDNVTQKTVLVVGSRHTYPVEVENSASQAGSTKPVFSPLPTPHRP